MARCTSGFFACPPPMLVTKNPGAIALTVILIACSLVIYSQIDFIRNKDLGYNRQAVLTFNMRGDMGKSFDAFKNEALAYPGIKLISRADNSLVQVNNQNGSVEWPGKPANSNVFFRTVVVDYDFLETMDLKLLDKPSQGVAAIAESVSV